MTDISNDVKDQTEKLYIESKNTISEYTSNLPANTITTVIVIILVLWIIIGFSGSFIILFLLISNIVCLYFLYQKNYITIKV